MDGVQLAKDLAQVALKHEPEKVKGGSPERQDWLRLVMGLQMIFLHNDWDERPFIQELQEGEYLEKVR